MRGLAGPPTFALLCTLAGCGGDGGSGKSDPLGRDGSAAAAEPWFVEVAAESGLDFVHVNAHTVRYWMPEISPGACALFDYDGDGRLDVFCVQSGDLEPAPGRASESDRLFRNEGNGKFRDVTDEAGVGDRSYGHGCATSDYDGDGDLDLFVANLGGGVLYRNDGDGTFTDATEEAGVRGEGWSTACSFLDIEDDGDLDLFVVHNLNWSPAIEIECKSAQSERDYCSPKNYNAPSQDTLFRNEGDGTFTDVSEEAGITAASGIGLGIACADYDGDGDVDVYVANDSVPNILWINDGAGHFRNEALERGCAVDMNGASEAGMGIQAFDLEEDGDWDLFITHIRGESNTLFRNAGGLFAEDTPATGLGTPSLPFTGWGLGFHDYDHDGRLDLFVANGRVDLWRPRPSETDPYAEPNQVYRGLGSGRFEEIRGGPTAERLIGSSRGAAFGDVDDDGDVDVLYQDLNGPVRLLRNEAHKRGRWVGFRLLNVRGSDALGAVVRIETANGPQHRLCHTSYSYIAANDPRVHFGLGAASELGDLLVIWPGNRRERFPAPVLDRYHTLRQGTGEPASQ